MVNYRKLVMAAFCGVALMAGTCLAQPAGGPPGRGGPGGRQMPPAMTFREHVAALADLYLSGDVDLTADQKAKIKDIRQEFQSAVQKVREDNKDLMGQMREARGDREKMRALWPKLRDMREAMNKPAQTALDSLNGVLTEDQKQAVDKKVQEAAQEMREMMGGPMMDGRMGPANRPGGGGRRGGGRGANGGGGGGGGNNN